MLCRQIPEHLLELYNDSSHFQTIRIKNNLFKALLETGHFELEIIFV